MCCCLTKTHNQWLQHRSDVLPSHRHTQSVSAAPIWCAAISQRHTISVCSTDLMCWYLTKTHHQCLQHRSDVLFHVRRLSYSLILLYKETFTCTRDGCNDFTHEQHFSDSSNNPISYLTNRRSYKPLTVVTLHLLSHKDTYTPAAAVRTWFHSFRSLSYERSIDSSKATVRSSASYFNFQYHPVLSNTIQYLLTHSSSSSSHFTFT